MKGKTEEAAWPHAMRDLAEELATYAAGRCPSAVLAARGLSTGTLEEDTAYAARVLADEIAEAWYKDTLERRYAEPGGLPAPVAPQGEDLAEAAAGEARAILDACDRVARACGDALAASPGDDALWADAHWALGMARQARDAVLTWLSVNADARE